MSDVRVSSWTELHERLYAGSWQEPLKRFRSSFAYRGMSDARARLGTTLSRIGGDFARQEGHLLRNFIKYAGDALKGEPVWSWLALAQHHGLPTRLLDWTFSPYVALHFVTQALEDYDVDGVVVCADYLKIHRLLPAPLRRVLDEEGSDVFTASMLDRAARTLPELDGLKEGGEFVAFMEPPSFDQRIVNQFALLSLMSSPRVQLDEWLAGQPEMWTRLVIPAGMKWEIRDKLDQANVTERVLFPGLDGLCRWQKRYYSAGPGVGEERGRDLRDLEGRGGEQGQMGA
jgi:hypothetical protein